MLPPSSMNMRGSRMLFAHAPNFVHCRYPTTSLSSMQPPTECSPPPDDDDVGGEGSKLTTGTLPPALPLPLLVLVPPSALPPPQCPASAGSATKATPINATPPNAYHLIASPPGAEE